MKEGLPRRKYLKHAVPDWVYTKNLSLGFFITVNCEERGKNHLARPAVWEVIEESVRLRQERCVWFCSLLLVMPDHIHGLFRFEAEQSMEIAFRDWKKWVSTQANIKWQEGFFDHRVRNTDWGIQKREYILDNPLRANLVTDRNEWKYKIDFLDELKR